MAVPCAVEVDVREGKENSILGMATPLCLASGGVDVAPCACRMSAARL
jgi:hypothetical protein